VANLSTAVDVVLMKSGFSRDDDLDLNLNELNLACLDEPMANQGIGGGGVLGASANFSPSGMLVIEAMVFQLVCSNRTFSVAVSSVECCC